jgi:hypothetical protein
MFIMMKGIGSLEKKLPCERVMALERNQRGAQKLVCGLVKISFLNIQTKNKKPCNLLPPHLH